MVQSTNTLVTNQIIGIAVLVMAVIVHAALNYLALGRQNGLLAGQNAHADAVSLQRATTNALQTDANRQATDATLHRWAPPVLSAAIKQIAADSGVTPDEVRASWTTYRARALSIGAARLVGWFPTLKADDARLLLEHLADTGGALLTNALPAIEGMSAPLLGQIGAQIAALPFNSLHIPPEIVQQAETAVAGLIPSVGLPPQAAAAPERLHVVEPSTGEVVGTSTPPPSTT